MTNRRHNLPMIKEGTDDARHIRILGQIKHRPVTSGKKDSVELKTVLDLGKNI